MNEEHGIDTVVDYDADIPDDMKIQPESTDIDQRLDEIEHGDKREDNTSDETVSYDPNNFEVEDKPPAEDTTTKLEKSPKGELVTRTFGIKRWKGAHTHTYTCIQCGGKRKSKHEINQHYRESHTSIKCPDCDQHFPTPDSLQRHHYVHAE